MELDKFRVGYLLFSNYQENMQKKNYFSLLFILLVAVAMHGAAVVTKGGFCSSETLKHWRGLKR